jgi:hypothetical protein
MTPRRIALTVLAALVTGGFPAARANDSSAILESGELQLTNSPDITLEKEDLYISADEIRVAYRFRNTSAKDLVTLVAFPLPDITVGDDANYSIDAQDPVNVIGFEVSVNGRRVEPNIQLRASRFGVDRTEILKRHGIPVLPFAEDFYPRLEKVSGADREELERAGLVDWHTSFGANNVPLPNPHWTAHAAYYWEQTFPAGAVTEVAHRYRPVPGESFYGDYILQNKELIDAYCMDRPFLGAARRLIAKAPNGIMRELHYILTTGRNWLGTIGEFNLTIDKGKPGNLVSLCVDGIKKTGPTTFEMHARDFIPERDLKILVLEAPAAQ